MVCFVGADPESLAPLTEALFRRRARDELASTWRWVGTPDPVNPLAVEALAALPGPVEPSAGEAYARTEDFTATVFIGYRNNLGFVPLPPGVRASVEVWPVEPGEPGPERMRTLLTELDRRAAQLLDDLLTDPDTCCGEGCANCVLDR
nr:oxidoreductase-like domain-containing protein [Granulicoccus phenolivorans]